IIAMILPMALPAATMCSKNDTITIVLDPSISGTDYSYGTGQSTWAGWFSYGTIRGISACLSSNYGKSQGGTVSNLHDNGELVIGGETNGEYCWCKMTHPVASLWVYSHVRSPASECAAYCGRGCGYYVRISNVPALRRGLFGSAVQNSLPQ
ncbi:MAG: hypothetical protein IK122_01630, partial [Alphaproteobacteria bacterium]|nr:hypothetical protein [Alphaproteobacteria bacterium]